MAEMVARLKRMMTVDFWFVLVGSRSDSGLLVSCVPQKSEVKQLCFYRHASVVEEER